jgi:hypothetical protein
MKLVRESLYEKFTADSDPISDMGIGMKKNLEKYSRWIRPENKDIMRIRDIVSKANGDHEKEARLARTMCKLITDREKSYRRYLAAKQIGGEDWEVTNIFMAKAIEMA